jgi:hypothetical protein
MSQVRCVARARRLRRLASAKTNRLQVVVAAEARRAVALVEDRVPRFPLRRPVRRLRALHLREDAVAVRRRGVVVVVVCAAVRQSRVYRLSSPHTTASLLTI